MGCDLSNGNVGGEKKSWDKMKEKLSKDYEWGIQETQKRDRKECNGRDRDKKRAIGEKGSMMSRLKRELWWEK